MIFGIIHSLVYNVFFSLGFNGLFFLVLMYKTCNIIPDSSGHVVLLSIGAGRSRKYDGFLCGKTSGQFFIRLLRNHKGWCGLQRSFLCFFWSGLIGRFFYNGLSCWYRNCKLLCRWKSRRCCRSACGFLFYFSRGRWSNLWLNFFLRFTALLLHAFLTQSTDEAFLIHYIKYFVVNLIFRWFFQ